MTPLNTIQCADLAFSLIASNGTISQKLFYTAGPSVTGLNATQHNLKGNGALMQSNAMKKDGISFAMEYSEMFSLQKGNC